MGGQCGCFAYWVLVSFSCLVVGSQRQDWFTMAYSLRCPIRLQAVSRRNFLLILVVGRRCGWLAILLRTHTSKC